MNFFYWMNYLKKIKLDRLNEQKVNENKCENMFLELFFKWFMRSKNIINKIDFKLNLIQENN